MDTKRLLFRVFVVAACAATFVVAGCATTDVAERADGRELQFTDFVSDATGPGALRDEDPSLGGHRSPDTPEPAAAATSLSATDSNEDGQPVSTAAPPTADVVPIGEPKVIDSLVGQVNGRPIFAEQFFEPIADQLRAESAGKSARQFADVALRIIGDRLTAVVLNELYLAEAEAALSTEQQVGLRYLLQTWEDQQLRLAQGSRTETDQRLLEEQGVTLNELREIARNEVLIRNLIRQRIQPRVIVSWKDVEREYQRRFAEFNLPGQITLGRIALFTEADAERIAQVAALLNSGGSFEDAATLAEISNRGTWQALELPAGGIADLPLAEAYVQQLQTLDVGEHAGPFEVGTRTVWVKIISIEQPPGRSVYDPGVQRLLRNQLEARRENEEMLKYRIRLLQEGSFDELEAMSIRLLEIAVLRYSRQA